jgi:RNA polymerase sigma factor for flagellar operon FliA
MSRSKYAGRMRRLCREQNVRTFPDERTLMAAWRAFKASPNDELRNRLVEHYLYLVRYAAERIRAKLPDEVDVEDLMSAGIFGLVDAIDAFDLERGVKFETYCAPRIRGAILDELRSMDWVPRLVRHRAHKLDETMRTLEAELGRIPTEDEIGRRLKLPPEQFEKLLRDASAISLVSLSQRLSNSTSERDTAEIDIVPDEQGCDPVTAMQKVDIRELITKELTRAEQLIVVLYYYEQMTMKEIGATLDLSESRVSQMHSAIIARLREQLGIGRLEQPASSETDVHT